VKPGDEFLCGAMGFQRGTADRVNHRIDLMAIAKRIQCGFGRGLALPPQPGPVVGT
jgi:hypothetical protein